MVERGKETFALVSSIEASAAAIFIDQDTKSEKVNVDFFGMKASTPIGAAVLALKPEQLWCRQPFISPRQQAAHWSVSELAVTSTGNEGRTLLPTHSVSPHLSRTNCKHPEQWLRVHERWKTRPWALNMICYSGFSKSRIQINWRTKIIWKFRHYKCRTADWVSAKLYKMTF